MESKKSEPNQTNQTKVKRTNRQATNSRQPRQIGIGMYCFSPSPYLPIFVPIYLYAYLRAYLCRLFACLCSRINTKRPLRTYTSHTLPPPIQERENLGSLSSIFFLKFFFGIFFLQNSTRFFFPQGSFLWLWVFLRECIF